MNTASARTLTVVAVAILAVVLVVLVVVNRSPAQEPEAAPTESQPVELITPSAPAQSDEPTADSSASSSSEPSTATVPARSEISREGLTAEELVIKAAETMTTWDATKDRSETDAYRRALPLFVPEYKDIFIAPEKPTLPAAWREAAEREAVSVPEVQVIGSNKQGKATHYQVIVTWTWTDNDGWELSDGPRSMEFQVIPKGKDFIIENWSENGLQ